MASNQQGKSTNFASAQFTKQVSKNKFIIDKNSRASPDQTQKLPINKLPIKG
jgi:hypothetical protein